MLAGARERILKALSCSGKDGREEEEEKGGGHTIEQLRGRRGRRKAFLFAIKVAEWALAPIRPPPSPSGRDRGRQRDGPLNTRYKGAPLGGHPLILRYSAIYRIQTFLAKKT